MSIQHRDLTSPGYDTQPPILLLAPDIQVTPALTALTALTAPTYLTVLTALTVRTTLSALTAILLSR